MTDAPSAPLRKRPRWRRRLAWGAAAFLAAFAGGTYWALAEARTLIDVCGAAEPNAPRYRLTATFEHAGHWKKSETVEFARGQTLLIGPLRRRITIWEQLEKIPGLPGSALGNWCFHGLLPNDRAKIFMGRLYRESDPRGNFVFSTPQGCSMRIAIENPGRNANFKVASGSQMLDPKGGWPGIVLVPGSFAVQIEIEELPR